MAARCWFFLVLMGLLAATSAFGEDAKPPFSSSGGVGNLGWIAGMESKRLDAPSGLRGMQMGIELGRGTRDFDMFDASQVDVMLRTSAVVLRRELSPTNTFELALEGGIGASALNEDELDDVHAKATIGPMVAMRLRLGDGLTLRPFLGLGLGAIWAFDENTSVDLGPNASGFAAGDSFRYGTAWRVGMDLVPGGAPVAVTLGLRRQNCRQDVARYTWSPNFDYRSDEVSASEGGFFLGLNYVIQP